MEQAMHEPDDDDTGAKAEAAPIKRVISKAPAPAPRIRHSVYVAPPKPAAVWSAMPPPAGTVVNRAPPEWVPLADVPGWIVHLYKLEDPNLLAWLTIAARSSEFLSSRVPNAVFRGSALPPGLASSRGGGKFSVCVADWDTATKGCPPGIVNGWNGQPHQIAVLWASVERWLPIYKAQSRKRAVLSAPTKAQNTRPEAPVILDALYESGAQGRPTSIGLIVPELERRRASGEVLCTQIAESEALAAWLEREHPKAAPAGAKAIRNSSKISATLREAVAEAKARKECPK
jgi:hypothetical protein